MKVQAEIHFLDQDQISVSLNIPVQKKVELYEGLLFALYVFRNWYSLGDSEPARGLVVLLDAAGNDIQSFIKYYRKGAIQVKDHNGEKAAKGFAAILNYDDEAITPIHFDLNPWGFGWLGTGLGYYSPTSVGALLQYLLERKEDESTCRYYEMLCHVISATLIAMPPPTKFNSLALKIATGAYESIYEHKRPATKSLA